MKLNKKILAAALAAAFAPAAHAVTYTWDCANNSFWDVTACWGPDGLPTSSDFVIISSPYQVTIDSFTGNAVASQLYVGGSGTLRQIEGTLTDALEYIGYVGNGSWLQSGGTHTVTSALYIGINGTYTGTYTQTGGTLNAANVYIGTADSKGIATVSNSTWNITSNATVGSTSATGYGGSLGVGSNGTVNIGGTLTVFRPSINNAKVGEVTTTGGGVIKVSGAMTLQGGKVYSGWGAVDSAGAIFAGDMITANGVTVGGPGSLWSTGTLIVGRNGTGTLTINADGKVTANSTYIAEFGGSTGNIVIGGSNALLQVSGTTHVGGGPGGSGGAGHLTVNSGGTATAGSLTVLNGSSNITTGSTGTSTGGIIDIAGALTLQGGGDATGYAGLVDNSYSGTTSGIYAGSASISGTGSRWDSYIHYTGYSGTGTTTVASGGTLATTNNTYVGYNNGSNGTLDVTASGTVNTSANAGLGFSSGSTGTATVGGTGALWNVAGGLWIGEGGTGALTVNSGGTVAVAQNITVGLNGGAKGTLTVNSGGTVQANTLTIYNGNSSIKTGTTASGTGGIIDIAGALTLQGGGDATGYYGFVDGSYSNSFSGIYAGSARISGTGSRWDSYIHFTGYTGAGTTTVASGGTLATVGNTYVGYNNGSNGTLDVTAGGTVNTNANADLAYNSGSTGTATVGGTGALWNVAGGLWIGESGTGTLTVNSGGTVTSGGVTYIGVYSGANGMVNVNAGGTLDTNGNGSLGNNSGATGTATVGGTGALWDVAGGLYVGGSTSNSGGAGILTVNSGGTVQAGSLTVYNASSSIKTGTTFSSAGGIIDIAGALTLQGGGDATSSYGFVDRVYSDTYSGIYAGSATITGSGSRWDSTTHYTGYSGAGTTTVAGGGTLATVSHTYVGRNNGSSGTLNVNAGGTVDTNGNGFLGYNSGATGTATVGGTGALWDVAGSLRVGLDGGAGTLTVNSGGTVNAGSLTVYNGNSSITTGATSTSTGGIIDIASALTLQGGGTATGYYGFVDGTYSDTASGIYAGSANISGTGSRWDSNTHYTSYTGAGTTTVASGGTLATVYDTFVGVNNGSNGVLNVNAGGTVDTNGNGRLGYASGSAGTGTVGGTGALWNIAGSLLLGESGTGTLTVNSGGTLATASNTLVGFHNGANGTLNVNAGGTVDTNIDGFVGFNTGSTGTATVGGTGALWDVAGSLFVGGNAIGSGGNGTLTVTTGGTVTAGDTSFLWDTGVLNLNGGTLNAYSLNNYGAFNFNAGTVNVTNNLTTNGFGAPGSIALGKFDTLTVGGTTTLNDYSTLDINGGSFSTGALVDNGGFAFNSGTFSLTNSNLVIGSGGLFGANVAFDSNRTVHVTNNVTINSGAILGLNNTVFTAGTWTNNGTVVMSGSVSSAGGGIFTNNKLLTGNGTVVANLANSTTGEVRATAGSTLTFGGIVNTNNGTVNLLGGTAVFEQGMTNSATGYVTGHGALIAAGGLTNNGQMAFTDTTDVQGDVDNASGGSIVVAGKTTTFYDDVVHNGAEFRVMNGAQAVFFGSYSGAGSFTGTGELVFAGDLKPGNSPALVNVEGDLTLLSTSITTMELGGLTRGSGYDAFDIGGTLLLGGTLDVVLYDLGGGIFNPQAGDRFDLFAATTIEGSFSTSHLASLGPSLSGKISYLVDTYGSTDVVRLDVMHVQAVPEPENYGLMLSGLALVFAMARRRQRVGV